MKLSITRRSRGIHAAWHFWYAVSFGGEGAMRKVGLGGIHPLTRRYVLRRLSDVDRISLSNICCSPLLSRRVSKGIYGALDCEQLEKEKV
ncbi:TPA: DUF3265 domain-containing protein [Vibrio vulnificus]|nr:DUF3265 domain-containing protein [Vibrio vulnificus]HDY8211357.1 DUF3265 domain-containing protein [Vibrio vulnificus]